jgi:energy-converting hydrogenase Eha subunit A
MVQPFLTAGTLNLSAMVCVIAFSVAIPLLAALVILNRQEAFRRRQTTSVLATSARVVAQNLALVGVVAGFWHIHWIAGVGMLAGVLVAVAVYAAGFTRLEHGQEPTLQEGDEGAE